jgi:hypothetical protein
MDTPKPMFVREVARIDDPRFVSGQVAGHRARRLIDAPDAAFADPFVLMAEDWTTQGIFAFHPHRGIETVTFVIEGAIEHRDSAGYGGVIHAYDEWRNIARRGDDGELFAAMLGHDDTATRLRESMPFVGLLPQSEVRRLHEEASA